MSGDSRKRKNFHGSSCDSVRQTLTRLSHCPLYDLVQTSSPNAVICMVCHKKLVNVKVCEEKLVALEGDVKNMLSSLTTVQSKRPLLVLPADTELQPPPPKQLRPAKRSLPFSQPTRVTLLTSHSSLPRAEHVSLKSHAHTHTHTPHTYTHTHTHTHTPHTYTHIHHTYTHTHTQEVSSTLRQSSSNITLICDSHQPQSPPCSQDSSSSSISLAQHSSTPQHGTFAPSQGLSPSVRVSKCHTHTHTHTLTYTHMHSHTHTHALTHSHTHTHTHMYSHTHTHTCTHTHTHTHTCTHTLTHTQEVSGTLTQSPPCSTPQHGTSAPSQGLSPSVRVSKC